MLHEKLLQWEVAQQMYAPLVATWRWERGLSLRAPTTDHVDAEDVESSHPEEYPLILPSSMAYAELAKYPHSIISSEIRLRIIQLGANLQDLRRLLRIKAGVYMNKKGNVTGQKGGTRAHDSISKFDK